MFKEGKKHHKVRSEKKIVRNRVRGGGEGALQVLGQRLPWALWRDQAGADTHTAAYGRPHAGPESPAGPQEGPWLEHGKARGGRSSKEELFSTSHNPSTHPQHHWWGWGWVEVSGMKQDMGKYRGWLGNVLLKFLFDSYCPSLS